MEGVSIENVRYLKFENWFLSYSFIYSIELVEKIHYRKKGSPIRSCIASLCPFIWLHALLNYTNKSWLNVIINKNSWYPEKYTKTVLRSKHNKLCMRYKLIYTAILINGSILKPCMHLGKLKRTKLSLKAPRRAINWAIILPLFWAKRIDEFDDWLNDWFSGASFTKYIVGMNRKRIVNELNQTIINNSLLRIINSFF